MRVISDNHIAKEEFENVQAIANAALSEAQSLLVMYRFMAKVAGISFLASVISLGLVVSHIIFHITI